MEDRPIYHVEPADPHPARRAWMRLPSGQRLDLLDPQPDAWLDSDLAIRLARTYRWGGESSWSEPLSVAQHSLTVLALRRASSAEPLTPDEELMELLHDGEEGFLGFDCIAPLKPVLGEAFERVASRLEAAIWARYGLPAWSRDQHRAHKRADVIAAASEAVHCVGWSIGEVREVLGITEAVSDVDPLRQLYGGTAWEPWPPSVAAERFAAELARLLGLRVSTQRPQPPAAPCDPVPTIVVRISPTIINEYNSRAVFGGDEEWPAVPEQPGDHELPVSTARAMLDDAEYNGSVGRHAGQGPDEMPLPVGNAYRALARQLREKLDPISGIHKRGGTT